ncbi:MAG: protein phosphatase [Candidatus Muproteobacteria bacterium RBG_19FT_COMBO_61_10]|uniref:Protein phosphatase n=1 Tax=Candidatus Muproteobacteria bacterium RBG_19FT_COMBO_61_10 TaxID=1817761 RepID=A0A1F6UHG5_9PROT|nr:MAG: protein phosphatase [Candidatus Muproteobacteria bacterium RBG_19FT_COMBO_61_10]
MSTEQLQTRIGYVSETGRRKANDDFAAALTGNAHFRAVNDILAVIADGVGGGMGGREAAETTTRGFIDAYYSLPGTLGVDRAAARALSAMNRWVYAQGRQDTRLQSMATTFTAVVLRGRQAHIVHVGDTRVYRLREHRQQRLTEDHTHHHPDLQHVLLRAVGLEASVRADYAVHGLRLHDRFLLCSDGLYGVLNDSRIQGILDERESPQETAERLVATALQAGSQDNVTALVLDVVGLPAADQAHLESVAAALPIQDLPGIGDNIDGFHLREMISDGRYSRLFRAEDTREQREVILKFPHPRVTADAHYRRAFVREAWVGAQVRSPYVGETIELTAGRQTRLYSVMPYYPGHTLETRLLRQPPVSLDEGTAIGITLAKAVYALNRLRIIHRDIKPDNVMLEATPSRYAAGSNVSGWTLKLLDLGVARLPGIQNGTDEDIPGTPSYMAPELFDGQAGDERSDVYALGVTLYRMYSGGHYPYGEVEPFSRPRFNKRSALTRHRPDLPAWLDAVLARATAVDSNERYADAMELAFELENGLMRGAKAQPDKRSWYERNPLRFWQVVSLLLALALVVTLALG